MFTKRAPFTPHSRLDHRVLLPEPVLEFWAGRARNTDWRTKATGVSDDNEKLTEGRCELEVEKSLMASLLIHTLPQSLYFRPRTVNVKPPTPARADGGPITAVVTNAVTAHGNCG
ncbi:hypothetical protein EVAR_43173_1 [Eumeta japonica]|uniref:Uncharacterized protein n=1 Tax=Eumeta variegata TaxID=151549 RepID=A0A4C1XKG3_EUMVA|nr:hypothetical protein EVAR_43173_1 [Eumeta japonica]